MNSSFEQHEEYDADVVIVGGGLSGMSAAYYILEYEPTMRILILEANDRIGGRVLSLPLKITEKNHVKTFDFGGQFLSTSQTHLMYLIKRLDLQLIKPSNREGKTVWNLQNSQIITTTTIGNGFDLTNIKERLELIKFNEKLKIISEEVTFNNPYSLEKSAMYDSQTMENFIIEHLIYDNSRDFIRCTIRITCGVEASDISVLFYLTLFNSTGGQLLSNENKWIQGGAYGICQKIASQIGMEYVKTNERVMEIMNNMLNISIETENNVYHCKFAIVAIPPKQVLNIVFNPPLSTTRLNLLKSIKIGHLVKFVATYKREFWRDKGLNGNVISCGRQGGHGPLQICLNISSKNDFALSGCIASTDCSKELYKEEILQQLAIYFGEDALKPLDYYEKSWNNESFIKGCYMNNPGLNNMNNYTELKEPIRRLFWAGTETAVLWNGYMGGAVQAGFRAAIELLYDYRPQSLNYTDVAFLYPEEKHIKGRPNIINPDIEKRIVPDGTSSTESNVARPLNGVIKYIKKWKSMIFLTTIVIVYAYSKSKSKIV